MLDEKDLQAIAQLMAQQKQEIIGELDVRMDTKMAQQKQEIIGELDTRMDQKLAAQKQEIMGELDTKLDSFKQETVAMMEAYLDPKFELLAEGQKTLLETLAPKSRVEQLEEEVEFLKTVIRSLSRDVAELKKAQ